MSNLIIETFVYTLAASLLLTITSLSLTTSGAVQAAKGQPKRLMVKLIHHDSYLSLHYNPSETTAERIERIMKSSLARVAYLYAKIRQRGHPLQVNDLRFNLLTSAYEPLFLVNFSIGQPPVPQLAILDTGSSLLWVKCRSCQRCSQQLGPALNPFMSTTFYSLTCRNWLCKFSPKSNCNALNECTYNLTYVAGLSSAGVLGSEQLVFQTSDEGVDKIEDVVFGCSYQNGNYEDQRFTGVFGLGYGTTSILNQIGLKFSYCLGNVVDPHYSYNHMVLGSGADLEGYSTPLRVVGGHYQVFLEGISIGEKRLVTDPVQSVTSANRKSAIIDTGTAITWLTETVYGALEDEVRSILDSFLTSFQRASFLCYKGTVDRDLGGFPAVTFHFADEADLVLDTGSMFYQATSDVFCMAVRKASTYKREFRDFSVIGLMAQQYYNMGYDLINSKLFFQRIDCQLLDE